jgi:hypothetical protein
VSFLENASKTKLFLKFSERDSEREDLPFSNHYIEEIVVTQTVLSNFREDIV